MPTSVDDLSNLLLSTKGEDRAVDEHLADQVFKLAQYERERERVTVFTKPYFNIVNIVSKYYKKIGFRP